MWLVLIVWEKNPKEGIILLLIYHYWMWIVLFLTICSVRVQCHWVLIRRSTLKSNDATIEWASSDLYRRTEFENNLCNCWTGCKSLVTLIDPRTFRATTLALAFWIFFCFQYLSLIFWHGEFPLKKSCGQCIEIWSCIQLVGLEN